MGGERAFGELLRETRKGLGMTQAEMAECLHITPSRISVLEAGKGHASKAAEALFHEKFGAPCPVAAPPVRLEKHTASKDVLMDEIQTARKELGKPMLQIELAAWGQAKPEELLTESMLLREAVELRATLELLAGQKALRKKWEAKQRGKQKEAAHAAGKSV